MWMGLVSSVEDFKKNTEVPQGKGNSASRLPSHSRCNISSSLGLQPASLPCRFWACRPPQSREPIPYNKYIFPPFSLLSLWRTLTATSGTCTGDQVAGCSERGLKEALGEVGGSGRKLSLEVREKVPHVTHW